MYMLSSSARIVAVSTGRASLRNHCVDLIQIVWSAFSCDVSRLRRDVEFEAWLHLARLQSALGLIGGLLFCQLDHLHSMLIWREHSTIMRIPPLRQNVIADDCSPQLAGEVDHDVADNGTQVGHDGFPFCSWIPTLMHHQTKKPTWLNTRRHSATSAYSSINPPARTGCSSASHPTNSHRNQRNHALHCGYIHILRLA